MKLTFFTMRFPVASETFVLNQATHFIDAGYDVDLFSVFPGAIINCHAAFDDYNLTAKTHYLPSKTAAEVDMEEIAYVLMEAMAVGLPVVSIFYSDTPGLIQNNVRGWLVSENDPRDLAQTLLRLSRGDVDVAPVVAAARHKVETEFNQHIAYDELAKILECMV